MAIVESGIGVLLSPRATNRQGIGRTTRGGTLPTPGGAAGTWFGDGVGNGLGFYVAPRLWTSSSDPTDPGLTWGIDWILGVAWADSGDVFGAPGSVELAGRIALPDSVALGAEIFDPADWLPTPGVNWQLPTQGLPVQAMRVQLAVRSDYGDEAARNALRAMVHADRLISWSGV